MTSAILATLLFLLMVAGVWCSIFGGIGSMLARQSGRRAVFGALIGIVLGPLGWFLAGRTRTLSNDLRLGGVPRWRRAAQ